MHVQINESIRATIQSRITFAINWTKWTFHFPRYRWQILCGEKNIFPYITYLPSSLNLNGDHIKWYRYGAWTRAAQWAERRLNNGGSRHSPVCLTITHSDVKTENLANRIIYFAFELYWLTFLECLLSLKEVRKWLKVNVSNQFNLKKHLFNKQGKCT